MSDLLRELLAVPAAADVDAVVGIDAWWRAHRQKSARHVAPRDLALWAGYEADRPAWAFLSGYQAALHTLLPSLSPDRCAALAVTEQGGNHPRAITTTLEGDASSLVLTGTKSFITAGSTAEELLVLATRGLGADGRPRLALVRVPAADVRVEDLPPMPFIPEAPHGRAVFDQVAVASSAVQLGDGYADYSKPFRTIEDAHVHGALVAYCLRLARRHRASDPLIADLVALAVEFHALCAADPKDPATHVRLGAALNGAQRVAADERLWDSVDEVTRGHWHRDRPLLAVAQAARTKRLEVALAALTRTTS